MHGTPRKLLEAQARSLGYSIDVVSIPNRCTEEKYQAIMLEAMRGWLDRGMTGVVFGDIFLEEVRSYREQNLGQIGVKAVFPLWGMDSNTLSQNFINLGYQAIITCVDTDQLSGRFAGREYDKQLLDDLPRPADPCGENGEFHTFVYDGPAFSRGIHFLKGKSFLHQNRFQYCDLVYRGIE